MAGKKRSFECDVVRETVQVQLRMRRVGGFSGEELAFVQCDQLDCQYVDENAPPCPLSLGLFAEELEAQRQRARQRREDSEY